MKVKSQLRIIAGDDRGRKLFSPADDRVRPTAGMAREAIFSILVDRIPDCDFLDLYAGTGSVGLEALSRGARTVALVEQDRNAIAILQKNIQQMSRARQCRLFTQTAQTQCERFKREERKFDVVFIDPPFDEQGISVRNVEPVLAPEGVLLYQRPSKWAVGDPFRGTTLVEYDLRRYGKSEISFWTFPENVIEEDALEGEVEAGV